MKRIFLRQVARALLFFFVSANVNAAATDLSSAPLVTSAASSVLPNLMFLLDDSGSMDWDYLPDWANSSNNALFQNNAYNGVAYDPSVVYSPPKFYNTDASVNTTTYPSMTSGNSGAWTSVKNDGYGIQSTTSSNLVGAASFYTFVPGEYCDKPNLRNCVLSTVPTVVSGISYTYPAALRWCTGASMSNCQAVRIDSGTTVYQTPRYPPLAATSTITVGGSGSTSVSGVTVGGSQIFSGSAAASTAVNTLATNIAAAINLCHTTAACDKGYSASVTNNVVTVTAPMGITTLPVVNKSGSMTVTPTAFNGGTSGSNILTNIVSATPSYPYPGTAAKATTRTDCSGSTCTYAEEMTNYANWWAYYHTRMQMMKTSASIAFQAVGANFRVGYATINNTQGSAFLNFGTFETTPSNQQKRNWYLKLLAAKPGSSTPLRATLSEIGRIFAGKFNGSTYNGVSVSDPMQYSCQQNFTILSTDGYWNEASGFYQLDGSTNIGQQDGIEPKPFNDGATSTVTTTTPSVTTEQKQTLTPVQVQTPWTRTTVSIGAACSIPAGPTPSACVKDNSNNSSNSQRSWCMTSSSNPGNSSECTGSIGSGNAWACRGTSNSTNLPNSGTACRTDSSGQNWCVYSNNTSGTGCILALSGDNIYICKPTAAVSGFNVTTATQSTTQTQTGNKISIDNYVTTTNTQVVSTNGIPAPASTSVVGPTLSNVSVTTDIVATATPAAGATWTNTSSSTVCTAAPLPSAGTSAAAAGAPGVPTATAPSFAPTTLSTVGPVTGTPTVVSTSSGGVSNTLSDVAEYYYSNDLRTPALGNCLSAAGVDVCTNDVPATSLDVASWQHMTTFTLGLGASGYMQFTPNYQTAKSGDYFDVANSTLANPAGGICTWQGGGGCNWPAPVSNEQTTIDDLWHAAVNGRGSYFSATNPSTLGAGLQTALSGVSARTGSSAAATTSNPNVTSGDNFVFSSTFTTNDWDGELVRQQLDLVTGNVLSIPSSASCGFDWCAQKQIDDKTDVGRTIYSYYSGAVAGSKFRNFDWATISAGTAPQLPLFQKPNIASLSQFSVLSAADQILAQGQNLVNFIRGDRTNEGLTTETTKFYRVRKHLLGDIVNAEAVYVKSPLQAYTDTGFSAYATSKSARQGVVYAAANDGMLHAFNAGTGAEMWSYIPELILPNLYKLADKNYSAQHKYFADGTPVSGDAYFGGAWHTIVVAGLNGGGRGYYAMDVTNPGSPPVTLWEYTNDNMGYTYGNPVITKLSNGQWVVLLASGYNNVPDGTLKPDGTAYGGDGVGRLFVLDAGTGALIRTISTGAGTPTSPSGLARISAWVNNATTDNTALRAYGGDMLGNVWRFDINSSTAAHRLVTLYANAAGTVVQPITTRPELGDVSGTAMVYVGTGRFLGVTDLNDVTQQSFYGIKDKLDGSTYGNPKGGSANFVNQVLTNTTCPAGSPATICGLGQAVRTSTRKTVNLSSQDGWYVDLPDGVGAASGTGSERANTDPTLALGTLGFTTNIPNSSACTSGGYSYRYLLDYRTGAPVSTSTTGVSAIKLGNALSTRGVFVRLPNNTVVQLTRLSDGTTMTTNVPIGTAAGPTRRISWRELIQDQ